MTIQGALYELNQMMKNEDIPLYLIPTLEKVIETVVDEFNQKWIPASERLPEKKNENYLIDYEYEGEECITVSFYDKYGFWSSSEVRAWQPLPEPYKAESENI